MFRKDALIRFYFNINPDTLSDSEWALSYESIIYALKLTGKIQEKE